jgi:hypothetical protein
MKDGVIALRWCPIRVVMSESLFKKQREIRDRVLHCFGEKESVLELGGCVVVRDGLRNIVITDCLIPRAEIWRSGFTVKDRDLSACWAEAEKSPDHCHLKPAGDMHDHPGEGCGRHCSGPVPSAVDRENSLRQSRLYHVFNLQESFTEEQLDPIEAEDQDGHCRYRVDAYTIIRVTASLRGDGQRPVLLKRDERRALWASLIAQGRGDRVSAGVVEHIYSAAHPKEPRILMHEDVPVVILEDSDVSALTGWPMDKVQLSIDSAALEEEVRAKYSTSASGWYSHRYHTRPLRDDHSWYALQWTSQAYYDRSGKVTDCKGFHGLVEPSEVAHVLREAASLLDGVQYAGHRYLCRTMTPVEIAEALEQCLRLLKGLPGEMEVQS